MASDVLGRSYALVRAARNWGSWIVAACILALLSAASYDLISFTSGFVGTLLPRRLSGKVHLGSEAVLTKARREVRLVPQATS